MRPYAGINASAHADPKLRSDMTFIDYSLQELYAAIGKLSAGKQPIASSGGSSGSGGINDHHKLINLATFDDHPQYLYLNGRKGGQIVYGATDANYLTLYGSLLDTNSFIQIGSGIVTNQLEPGGTFSLVYSSAQSLFLSQVAASGQPRISTTHSGSFGIFQKDIGTVPFGITGWAGQTSDFAQCLDSNSIVQYKVGVLGDLQLGKLPAGAGQNSAVQIGPFSANSTPGIALYTDSSTTVDGVLTLIGHGRIILYPGRTLASHNAVLDGYIQIGNAHPGDFAVYPSVTIVESASQAQDAIQVQNSSNVALSGFTAAGNYYLLAGKGLNKTLASDANGVGSWVGGTLLDGTLHNDTVAHTPVRGDIIVANSTPAWAAVAKGTAYQLVGTDGTDTKFLTPLMLVGQAYSPATPNPALAPAGDVFMWSDNMGTSGARVNPAMVRQEGRVQWLQGNHGWNGAWLIAPNFSTSFSGYGVPSIGTDGTITTPAIASTNLSTSARNTTITSASAINSSASMFSSLALVWAGNAAGLGGYYLCTRFCIKFDTTATPDHALCFIGLLGQTTTIGNTVPSNLTNMVGIGADGTDANLQIMCNDGSGVASKVDLGTNYTPSLASTAVIQLELYCPPNGSTYNIYYRVMRLDNTSIAPTVGSLTSNLPVNTTMLSLHLHLNTGTSATDAVILKHYRTYCECDV